MTRDDTFTRENTTNDYELLDSGNPWNFDGSPETDVIYHIYKMIGGSYTFVETRQTDSES